MHHTLLLFSFLLYLSRISCGEISLFSTPESFSRGSRPEKILSYLIVQPCSGDLPIMTPLLAETKSVRIFQLSC